MEKKKQDSRPWEEWLIKHSHIILIAGLVILVSAPILATSLYTGINFTKTGEIGDTIGGITAPIAHLIGAFLVFISFKTQIRANEIQQKALKKEKIEIIRERLNSRLTGLANATLMYTTCTGLFQLLHLVLNRIKNSKLTKSDSELLIKIVGIFYEAHLKPGIEKIINGYDLLPSDVFESGIDENKRAFFFVVKKLPDLYEKVSRDHSFSFSVNREKN